MTRLVVIAGFLVSFAAGVLVGMEARKRPNVTAGAATLEPTSRPSRSSWLASELGLTSEQQKALDKIWSETAGRGRGEMEERRRQIRKERDDALTSLVRPEDKAEYDAIFTKYQEQQAAIERDMRANFENAVKMTKELLTPDQRVKYDQLLQRHQWDRGGPGSRGGPGRRGDDRPGSRPSSQPSQLSQSPR